MQQGKGNSRTSRLVHEVVKGNMTLETCMEKLNLKSVSELLRWSEDGIKDSQLKKKFQKKLKSEMQKNTHTDETFTTHDEITKKKEAVEMRKIEEIFENVSSLEADKAKYQSICKDLDDQLAETKNKIDLFGVAISFAETQMQKLVSELEESRKFKESEEKKYARVLQEKENAIAEQKKIEKEKKKIVFILVPGFEGAIPEGKVITVEDVEAENVENVYPYIEEVEENEVNVEVMDSCGYDSLGEFRRVMRVISLLKYLNLSNIPREKYKLLENDKFKELRTYYF